MASKIAIDFIAQDLPETGTVVLFSGSKKSFSALLKKLDKQCEGQISKAMSVSSFEGQENQLIEILSPAKLNLSRILVLGLGDETASENRQWMNIGGRIGACAASDPQGLVTIMAQDIGDKHVFTPDAVASMATGYLMRRYEFDKYKKSTSEKASKPKHTIKTVALACKNVKACASAYKPLEALRAGVFMARDLVNEPGNILGPVEFALQIRELESLGLKVTILDEAEMAASKMNALLAVGQGSVRESRLAIMQWNGSDNAKDKPLAIVGKGVTFDSGGVSIKPSAGMEDMKGDMGGAACVTGLMRTLATRKAKANIIGVVGLTENMPDGKSYRPGDVVTSMSGQTIEVLNTDAEGRLVLADVLTYTIKHYKPTAVIDLATLTGAILVALGKEYAGLFSNNERLAKRLLKAGEVSGEKLWRMPLGKAYDKLIDSRIADMKNTGGRLAGSTTAAQFLQRYVGDTPWAHLDIAGTAMASPKSHINQSWGAGFGIQLLNELIMEHYE
ncbi:MAG: leucyl aminopeptidase [Hyphomicrobiaceae bacterium]|nr:leucyl aminopeptidase [Hyphomicrobiaceae bacterium]